MKAFFVLLRHFFPIWGGIAIIISVMGLLIAQLEKGLSTTESLYFAWVTGTTVGYGDVVPTAGSTRVLAIIVAIMGIVFTGIIVATAIEAAKFVVENSVSIQEFKQSVREGAQLRAARGRKRRSESEAEG